MWEGEFADEAALKKYEQIADSNPDFSAVRRQMGMVTTRTERKYFREAR